MAKARDIDIAVLRQALADALRQQHRRHAPYTSQAELSRRIGIDLGGLERAERLPSIGVVWQLARIFRTSPARLVSDIDLQYRRLQAEAIEAPLDSAALKPLLDFMNEADSMKWLAGPQQKNLYCNPPLLQYLGMTLEQVVGVGWHSVIHPEDLEKYLQRSKKSYSRRQPFRTRYRIRRADGVYESVVQEAVPHYTQTGEFIGFMAVMIVEPGETAENGVDNC